MAEQKNEKELSAQTLSDAEKRLRDWLMQHPEGGEMWMIVKSGFRRSTVLALDAAAEMLDRRAQGGTAYKSAANDVRALRATFLNPPGLTGSEEDDRG